MQLGLQTLRRSVGLVDSLTHGNSYDEIIAHMILPDAHTHIQCHTYMHTYIYTVIHKAILVPASCVLWFYYCPAPIYTVHEYIG